MLGESSMFDGGPEMGLFQGLVKVGSFEIPINLDWLLQRYRLERIAMEIAVPPNSALAWILPEQNNGFVLDDPEDDIRVRSYYVCTGIVNGGMTLWLQILERAGPESTEEKYANGRHVIGCAWMITEEFNRFLDKFIQNPAAQRLAQWRTPIGKQCYLPGCKYKDLKNIEFRSYLVIIENDVCKLIQKER